MPTSHCGFSSATRTSNWRERSSPTAPRCARDHCADAVIAHRDQLARVHAAARARAAVARADVRVSTSARGGAGLQVFAALDEAFGDYAGEWCADHGLLDLVLHLAQLCLGARQIVARHFALRARILELAGAQGLCGREAVEALELRVVDVALRTGAGHLCRRSSRRSRATVSSSGRAAHPGAVACRRLHPHDAPGDHAGDARIRAADDRSGYPASIVTGRTLTVPTSTTARSAGGSAAGARSAARPSAVQAAV